MGGPPVKDTLSDDNGVKRYVKVIKDGCINC